MARKTKEEAEKTRALILETALRVFHEKGYSGSTLVDIAKEINLTKGAIYHHFKSKNDLFLELARTMEERIEAGLSSIYPKPGDLVQLKDFAVKIVQFIVDDPQLNRYYSLVYYRMEWHDELLQVKEFFTEQDESLNMYLIEILREMQKRGTIRQELSVQSVAAVYQAMLDGFIARVLMSPEGGEQQIKDMDFGMTAFFAGLEK